MINVRENRRGNQDTGRRKKEKKRKEKETNKQKQNKNTHSMSQKLNRGETILSE